MVYYQNVMNELTELIRKNKLPYENTIFIGNNSSGKSELLKRLIIKDSSRNWYLIDSVNRYFNVGQVFKIEGEKTEVLYSDKILEHRLAEDNYNLKDTFYYGGIPTPIENFYFEFENEIKRLFHQFLGIDFEIKQSEIGYKIYLDGIESMLSSGYQALVRIFMEMEYAAHTMRNGCVVIDEIDEYLFAYNSGRIFEFLRQVYKDFSFIVTTHSADLIANSKSANIILLSGGQYEILDAEDFNSVTQVYNIFSSIFQDKQDTGEKEKTDASLRRLLNNKITGIWGVKSEDEFEQIKNTKLTKLQKVLVRKIEEW